MTRIMDVDHEVDKAKALVGGIDVVVCTIVVPAITSSLGVADSVFNSLVSISTTYTKVSALSPVSNGTLNNIRPDELDG